MDAIIEFIKENDYIIGIAGLVISGMGVFYGRMAYRTALNIFRKGLQIDEDKVFSQIGLEIVLGFVIPYNKFKSATESIWNGEYSKLRITTVRDNLDDNKFSVAFPYLDIHKGELWDALDHRKGNQASTANSFLSVMQFYESAKMLSDGIRALDEAISKYLEGKKGVAGIEIATLTLADFFKESQYVNDVMFHKGLELMKEVDERMKLLPEELRIKERFQELSKA